RSKSLSRSPRKREVFGETLMLARPTVRPPGPAIGGSPLNSHRLLGRGWERPKAATVKLRDRHHTSLLLFAGTRMRLELVPLPDLRLGVFPLEINKLSEEEIRLQPGLPGPPLLHFRPSALRARTRR